MPLLASRLQRIQPSPTLALNARAAALKAEGVDVINLAAGEPDFETPTWVQQAAVQSMEQGMTKYTAVDGIPTLKKAIQQKFVRDNHLEYDLDQIVVSTGGKQVLFNALMATIDDGDEVIIPAPYWVSYPDMVAFAEGTPIIVPCSPDDFFKLTPHALEAAITSHTKWLVLNSPNNPTGMAYTASELEALAAVLRKHPHVYILSDDIYEHLVYDGFKFATLAQISPDLHSRILTVNGVSKSYAMTGWRIGYGVGPQALIKAMAMLQSQSTSNASSVSQEAARAALEGPQDFMTEWRSVFMDRRDQALRLLNAIPGLSCLQPQGAFYLYPSCEGLLGKKTPSGDLLKNDADVSAFLLDTAGVAVVPGIAFGLSPYFRLSYAINTQLLREGCHRIAQAIDQLHA